ncbi:hypothetical protein ACFSNO_29130 [Streptomyces cirratus]
MLGSLFHAGLADGLGGSGRRAAPPRRWRRAVPRAIAGRRPGGRAWVEAAFVSGLRETFVASGVMGLLGALAVALLIRSTGRSGGAPQAGARPADAAAVPERV